MMMTSSVLMPLADITNSKVLQANKLSFCAQSPEMRKPSVSSYINFSPDGLSPSPERSVVAVERYSHNPYNWRCIPDEDEASAILAMAVMRPVARRQQHTLAAPIVVPMSVMAAAPAMPSPAELFMKEMLQVPVASAVAAPALPAVTACKALVQFKCHQTEFSSPIIVDKGQYVVVQGDRGIDIGVVIRVNTDTNKSYVERTGPNGSILRHATQREVDYWATDLKADEATALEFCRERTLKMRLPMEVKHAEYQFDKKKLTFYYEAKARVDFVAMLKDLYREFGCRIWMEKVRLNQIE